MLLNVIYYFALIFVSGIIDDPAESLFTYQDGQSWATYYSPSFIPVYDASFKDADLEAKAREVCDNDTFCLFDIAATGKVELGMSTHQGSQEFERIVELSAPGSVKISMIVISEPCNFGLCYSGMQSTLCPWCLW